MLIDGKEIYVRELGYEQLRVEADRHRFERDVLGLRTDLPRPCCATLCWIGRRLAAWGEGLQAKYGDFSSGEDLAAGAH
jgi:hypothetical protein